MLSWNKGETLTRERLTLLALFCMPFSLLTAFFAIPMIVSCNETVQSTIRAVRPGVNSNCFYDVSYSVGQNQYNETVGYGCPSSLFNSTQNSLNLCYSHFDPGKCEVVSAGHYTKFSKAMTLTCTSATLLVLGWFSFLCVLFSYICPTFTFLEKGSVGQQVQVTPV